MRVGNENNLWDMKKHCWESVKQAEWAVKLCEQFGRKVATAEGTRKMIKVGELKLPRAPHLWHWREVIYSGVFHGV